MNLKDGEKLNLFGFPIKDFLNIEVYLAMDLLGPLIRILYLYSMFIIIFSLLYSFSIIKISPPSIIRENIKFILSNDKIFLNIFLALFIGSGLHTITDIITTSFKKKTSSKKKNYKKKKTIKK